jgi:hypothetical protein
MKTSNNSIKTIITILTISLLSISMHQISDNPGLLTKSTNSALSYIAEKHLGILESLFDVRDITINNAQPSSLNISVTLENIGTAQTDMHLSWDLSKEDTGETLNSGAEEIGVNPGESIIHNIYPETSYTGKTRITFLGYYGPDKKQKAGAYKIFTTSTNGNTETETTITSPKQDPTTTTPYSIQIVNLPSTISIAEDTQKNIQIKNDGTETLTNIAPALTGIASSLYSFSPTTITKLLPGETRTIALSIAFTEQLNNENALVEITSDQTLTTKLLQITTITIKEQYINELSTLQQKILITKNKLIENEYLDLLQQITECEDYSIVAQNTIQNTEYKRAQKYLEEATKCLDHIDNKTAELSVSIIPIKYQNSLTWLVTWALIILLIIIIALAIIPIYKKIKIADFIKQSNIIKPAEPQTDDIIKRKIEILKQKLS